MPRNKNVWLFGVVLGLAALYVVLFASGLLRFNVSGTGSYFIYVLCGLFVAIGLFGILPSSGEVSGIWGDWRIQFGGPAAGFLIVVVGGAIYEKYYRTPESFNVQILFYENDEREPAAVAGDVDLPIGDNSHSARVDGTGRALIQGISSQARDQEVTIRLRSTNWILDQSPRVKIHENQPIYLKVKRKSAFAAPEDSAIVIDLSPNMGSAYLVGPDPSLVEINLQFNGHSTAQASVPLDPRGEIAILSNAGNEVFRFPVTLNDGPSDGVVLRPDSASTFYVSGQLNKAAFRQYFGTSFMWTLTTSYDRRVKITDKQFGFGPQDFNKAMLLDQTVSLQGS